MRQPSWLRRTRSRSTITLIGVTVAAVFVAGIATASIPNSTTKVIAGCYSNANGALRVIDAQAGATCAAGETKLTWNQKGPTGPRGPTGPPGPKGPQGVYLNSNGFIGPAPQSRAFSTSTPGTVVLQPTMTAFASATGFIYLAWKIDTTTRAFCEAYANSANVHMTLACTSYPGPLAAGSHTIQVVSGGGFTVTDSNDDFNYLITVYPSS